MKGDGRAFLKTGKDRAPRWCIAYYHEGKEHREPAWITEGRGRRPAQTEAEAEKALHLMTRSLDRGEAVTPTLRRVTVNELLDAHVAWLTNQKKASVNTTISHLKPVRAYFGRRPAIAVTSIMVEKFKTERTAAGKKPATVNRGLQALAGAYSWGARQQPALVKDPLLVSLLDETGNVRTSFFPRADYEALVANLGVYRGRGKDKKLVPDVDLQDFVEWGFYTGMRKGEIAKLTWAMFDKETWALRLHPKSAKTRRGRVIVLKGAFRAIIERRLERRRLDCHLIFHRTVRGVPGRPIQEFRKSWASACKAVGLTPGRAEGFTFHDTRRTASRNLMRAIKDRTVAKKITGHITDSTFERYNITDEEDLGAAADKVTAYVESLPTERKVAKLVRK